MFTKTPRDLARRLMGTRRFLKKIRLNVIQIIGDALAGATMYLSENTKDHF